ncbi:MAG: ABC transporter ATP-binding protein/permease [Propionibacteriaceae bacterium]|jgi:ATP-binding cassette subfamily B protein|nr:ABC transporter ATP-binding protein/permease [Propionibacteriaceae bacterium]
MKNQLSRLVARFLKPYWRLVALVLLLQFGATIASLFLPRLNANIIDYGVSQGDVGYIWRTGGLMLAVSASQILCQVGAVYCGAKAAMSFGRDIRAGLFGWALRFSSHEINQLGAPSLITRNTNDVMQVQMIVMLTFTMLVSAPITMIGGVIMALQTNLSMSWLIAVAVGSLLVIGALLLVLMRPLFKVMQKRIDNVNRVLREHISGIRVVRAFVREPQESERFGQANRELTEVGLKVGRIMMTLSPLIMMAINLSTVGVMWFGARQIDQDSLQIGQLTAFISYLMQILMSVMMATVMLVLLPRAIVCAQRIMEVLDTKPGIVIPDNPEPIDPANPAPTIEFEQVNFRYPGAEIDVLSDISFSLIPGQTTAIVGATGSGKTTLVSLIPRLFDPTKGQVRIHGTDVSQVDTDDLWNRMSLIPQKAYLFSGTVASNLRYGKPDATEDEMWAALETAQAADFVREMDDQLEAPIAQGGTNVSGGQRQRLSIARALIKEPEIYVFDDSFSALDVATDARLRQALATETGQATVLIVAQRISTVRQADQILVLDDGTIVGRGRHEELLQTCQTYQEIVESQLSIEEMTA